MSLIRRLLAVKLGALLGVMLAAVLAKRFIPSRGDAESDDLSLVAIFDGVKLKSRSQAFTGGSALAWFGGIELDLSRAQLADGARLSANAIFGGIDVVVPPSWRVESTGRALLGGIDAPAAPADPGAPVLALDGMAVFGGIAVRSAGDPVVDSG
jgi:hypothetical protein